MDCEYLCIKYLIISHRKDICPNIIFTRLNQQVLNTSEVIWCEIENATLWKRSRFECLCLCEIQQHIEQRAWNWLTHLSSDLFQQSAASSIDIFGAWSFVELPYIRSIYSITFLHSVDNNNKYNWIFTAWVNVCAAAAAVGFASPFLRFTYLSA